MDFIRYLITAISGVLGLWILVLNWQVFWKRHIKGMEAPSWIPLLAGCLLCVSFLILPFNSYRWLCWLAFVIDWGSLPGIAFSIWHGVKRSSSHR